MATSSDVIRIGRISSIDYKRGMASVTYPDRDGMVTAFLPVLSFTGEYRMPEVDSEVLVCHLSNGSANGVIVGKFWDVDNLPPVYGKGLFIKELGSVPGAAYISCEDDEITFHDKNGTITLKQIIEGLS